MSEGALVDEHRERRNMEYPDYCPYCNMASELIGDELVPILLARHNNNRWSCCRDKCWEKAERNEEYPEEKFNWKTTKIGEDKEFAEETEKAYKRIEKGEGKEMTKEEFLEELDKW